MKLHQLENVLREIFEDKNVKPHAKGFRIIIDYNNMPYCIVLRLENDRLVLERDAVDENENHYEEAYKKAYKMLIQNKEKFHNDIIF
jgi:hypothetical protein